MRLHLALAFVAAITHAESPRGYYRHPTIHGNAIVFTAEGDLWRADVKGGTAQRLTSHAGSETFAHFSPDGKTIAFIGNYEGISEVYTMPAEGGRPQRQTFEGGTPRIASWTPDGKVLYSTDKFSTLPNTQLVELDPTTHDRKVLPLAQASDGVFDPDTKTLFFVRLPKQSSTTKRYRAGWVENLWRFKQGDAEAVQLDAKDLGTNRDPMWWQGRLYFLSDRDGTLNIWSCKADGTDLKQHTKHKDFDMKYPSLDGGRIAYQRGADLWLHDITSAQDSLIDIRLVSDLEQEREQWIKKPLDYLTSWHVSPSGDRVALTSRGEVFVAPTDTGRFVELPRKEGVRYRGAQFVPDGKSLLLQSDESGEFEFWKAPANGLSAPERVTTNGRIFRFAEKVSPDGKWLAYSDKDAKFWVMSLEAKQPRLISEARMDEINDYEWSPDSAWIAFSEAASNLYSQIKLYRLSDASIVTATTDRFDSHSPAWSPDGKWLYFLSERDMRTLVGHPWGARQPEPHFTEMTKVYALALTKGLRSPFLPKDETITEPTTTSTRAPEMSDRLKTTVDELVKLRVAQALQQLRPKADIQTPNAPKPAEQQTKNDTAKPSTKTTTPSTPSKPKAPVVVKIDLDGLTTRLIEVPASPGNFKSLSCSGKHLFWTSKPTAFQSKKSLVRLEIGPKHKPATLAEDIGDYELTADTKKIMLRKGDNFYVFSSDGPTPAPLSDSVNLSNWTFPIHPQEEWHQIFNESWRMMRDYFWDKGMSGLDWPAIKVRYAPLVDRVTDRNELNDVISEMMGELSTLHIFVRYGDTRNVPDKIEVATFGSVLDRDADAGGWRVKHVYQTDPDFPSQLTPFARPEVDIKAGDVIIKINGKPTLEAIHPDQLLRNLTGKQVLVEVKSGDKTRQVIVKPVNGESAEDTRYDEWEYTRRLKVDQDSLGKIGYVHLRAMGGEDIEAWARDFYPVFNRQGLIIDVRNNHGGNIDSWIIEKLLRKAWSYFQGRTGEPMWNMQYAFRGHVAVICNQRTASDGEGFCTGVQRLKIGKVFGTRTWGGGIWLSAQKWLVDSGMATAAEMGVYGPEGQWLVEGKGVDPDVVVENLPHATFNGSDAQLDAAIKHLKDEIAKDPRPVPARPEYPSKR